VNAAINKEERDELAALRRRLEQSERARIDTKQRLERAERRLQGKNRLIERLEQRIADLVQARWGRSSEKDPGQGELSLFNEAELAAMIGEESDDDVDGAGGAEADADSAPAAPSKPAKPRKRRQLPDGIERVRVTHELSDAERHGACGATLMPIGEEITEQLGILPQRHFVIQHVKVKYACSCKGCGVRTAPMPTPPIPGSQASPSLLSWSMMAKYHYGLPLYRQERIAATFGVDLSRGKLARWLILSSKLLQPLYNLMEESLFAYDIVATDDTGIQVLKEDGRAPSTMSALWIRRGGAPQTPVVLMDYRRGKGEAEVKPLLDRCEGYLVSDAAPTFENVCVAHALIAVLCNDHARRKFVEAARKPKGKGAPKGWIATKAIGFYKRLYRIEREATEKRLTPDQRRERRQRLAVPVWEEFMSWAKRMQIEGVRDAKTRAALAYLINHESGLRRYCEDGRLPISNILSEHVAKTVAVARKYAQRPVMRSAGPRRLNDATSRLRASHNHRARRNAASVSGGRYRPAFVPGACTRASACSFIARSASM